MVGAVFVRRLREGKTYGDFVDVAPDDLQTMGERVLAAETTRHERIDAVIESTALRTFFVVDGDHDFSDAPVPLSDERRGFPWA